MKRRLIVNADDFGIHSSISTGVEKAIQYGIVKSISFIVNTGAFEDSLRIIKRYREVSTGIHLNITDGKPVSNTRDIDFLLNGGGAFYGNHLKTIRSLVSHINCLPNIKAEFEEQIKKLLDSGVRVSHIDSHGHIHLLPHLLKAVTELAKTFHIPFVRIPKERLFCYGPPARWKDILIINLLSKLAVNNLKREKLRYVDDFIGIESAGKITKKRLINLIRKINCGVTEMAVHPGENAHILSENLRWDYSWNDELLALTDDETQEEIKHNKIHLVNFYQIL